MGLGFGALGWVLGKRGMSHIVLKCPASVMTQLVLTVSVAVLMKGLVL